MGVRAIFQLETPWSQDEVFDLGFEQGADTMVFTHLKHRQVRLTRYGHDVWSILYANYLATVVPPSSVLATGFAPNTGTGYSATTYTYVVTTIDEGTDQESLASAEVTNATATDLTLKGNHVDITWTAVPGAVRYNIYRKGGGAFGFIGTTEDETFTDDNIAPDFSQSYPVARDPFESQSEDDLNGHKPAVVAFWDQRAVYGRTLNKPNGLFASQQGNLFNFNVARPVQPTDAVTFAVSGRRVNAILHLVPLKNLIVFTTDTVFSISGNSANGGGFSPTDINITPEGYRGANRVRPIVIDDIVMFGTAKGGQLRSLGYQFEADGYRGNDLTIFAAHLFRNVTMADMTWAEYPTSTVSVICSDGQERLLTWQAEQQVWGWSKSKTAGFDESCCTVSEGGEDVVYYITKRTVNGIERRYIEYNASLRWENIEDAVYLDSALVYNGDPETDFGGIEHLEGETINVLADGAVYSDLVVSNGGFSLPQPASKVIAGLPYEAWIRTLPFGLEQEKGEPKIVAGATVRVFESRGIEVGVGRDLPPGQTEPNSSDDEIFGLIDEIKTRELEPMGEPTRLFSGELQVDVEGTDWRTADVVVRQRNPLPMTVLGITPEYLLSE